MIFASHLFQPLQAVADLYLCHAGLRRAGALGFVRCDWRTLPGAGRHLELIIGKLGEGWCQGFLQPGDQDLRRIWMSFELRSSSATWPSGSLAGSKVAKWYSLVQMAQLDTGSYHLH